MSVNISTMSASEHRIIRAMGGLVFFFKKTFIIFMYCYYNHKNWGERYKSACAGGQVTLCHQRGEQKGVCQEKPEVTHLSPDPEKVTHPLVIKMSSQTSTSEVS